MAKLLRILLLASLFVGGYFQNQNCPCPLNYDPVCGADGRTYANKCSAACWYIPVRCQGPCPCPPNCGCGYNWDPVCSWVHLRTYPTPCVAKCNYSFQNSPGPCPWDSRYRGNNKKIVY